MSGEIDPDWLPPDPVDPSWAPPQPMADGGTAPEPSGADSAATGWLRRNSVWVAALAGLLGVGVGALVVLAIVPRPSDQAPPKASQANTPSSVALPQASAPSGSPVAPPPAPVGQAVPNPYSGPGQNVKTVSGRVHCYVTATGEGTGNHGPTVICEASSEKDGGFLQAPMTDYGEHYHAAVTDAAGNFHFGDGGNLGDSTNAFVLNYGQTYHFQGWTITASTQGTRFTNDQTGHGMFVSIENTYPF